VRVSLGRKEGCDIIINEAVVSGNHCYITVLSRGLAQIEDVSTNGTYINSVKIGKGNRMDLREGDILTLGKPNAPGPVGGGSCVNFRATFDGSESDTAPKAVIATSSMQYKQQIEDLKVQVSQGEYRNETLVDKTTDLAARYNQMESEVRRVNERNVELQVRNESMKTEIDGLRLRISQADLKAENSERRAETVEAKLAAFEREYADIAAIKAEFNLRNGSLRDEIERLRRTNFELSSKLTQSGESRKRIVANLVQLQQTLGISIRLVEEMGGDTAYPMVGSDARDGRVVVGSSAVVRRGPITVPTAYMENPVESVAPPQADGEVARVEVEEPIEAVLEEATTPAMNEEEEQEAITTETPGLLQGLFGSH